MASWKPPGSVIDKVMYPLGGNRNLPFISTVVANSSHTGVVSPETGQFDWYDKTRPYAADSSAHAFDDGRILIRRGSTSDCYDPETGDRLWSGSTVITQAFTGRHTFSNFAGGIATYRESDGVEQTINFGGGAVDVASYDREDNCVWLASRTGGGTGTFRPFYRLDMTAKTSSSLTIPDALLLSTSVTMLGATWRHYASGICPKWGDVFFLQRVLSPIDGGYISRRDGSTGATVWSVRVGDLGATGMLGIRLLIRGGYLIVYREHTTASWVKIFDPANGDIVWEQSYSHQVEIAADNTSLLVFESRGSTLVTAHDFDGAVQWTRGASDVFPFRRDLGSTRGDLSANYVMASSSSGVALLRRSDRSLKMSWGTHETGRSFSSFCLTGDKPLVHGVWPLMRLLPEDSH